MQQRQPIPLDAMVVDVHGADLNQLVADGWTLSPRGFIVATRPTAQPETPTEMIDFAAIAQERMATLDRAIAPLPELDTGLDLLPAHE